MQKTYTIIGIRLDPAQGWVHPGEGETPEEAAKNAVMDLIKDDLLPEDHPYYFEALEDNLVNLMVLAALPGENRDELSTVDGALIPVQWLMRSNRGQLPESLRLTLSLYEPE